MHSWLAGGYWPKPLEIWGVCTLAPYVLLFVHALRATILDLMQAILIPVGHRKAIRRWGFVFQCRRGHRHGMKGAHPLLEA